jgi:hypothetical protein
MCGFSILVRVCRPGRPEDKEAKKIPLGVPEGWLRGMAEVGRTPGTQKTLAQPEKEKKNTEVFNRAVESRRQRVERNPWFDRAGPGGVLDDETSTK